MFAYVVKRLLAGVVVLAVVSAAIFILFWYGPSSPARPICDRETNNRCSPVRLERYERSLGYNVNLVWGAAVLLFGLWLLFLSRRGTAASRPAELDPEGRAIEEREVAEGLETENPVARRPGAAE